jgi:hypothetical protein
MTKLIIEGPCLVLQPALSKKLGLNESIILQQIHYWIVRANKGKFQNSHTSWIYNTYEQWQKQFCFFSERTIRRAIKSLEKQGILLTKSNKSSYVKVKYYTINYCKIAQLGFNLCNSSSTVSGSFFDHVNDSIWPDEVDNLAKSYSDLKNNSKNIKEYSLSDSNIKAVTKENISENKNCIEREMLSIWNQIFIQEGREEVQFTKPRAQQLYTVFKTHFESSLKQWKDYCHKIITSKFLMGETKHSNFKASLDWSIKPDNIVKILEGQYGIGDRAIDNSSTPGVEPAPHTAATDELWKQVLKCFEDSHGIPTVKSWLSKLEFERLGNSTIKLSSSSKFILETVDRKYKEQLIKYFDQVSNNPIKTIVLAYGSEVITYTLQDNYPIVQKSKVKEHKHNEDRILRQTDNFEEKNISKIWKAVIPLIKLQENNLTTSVP